MLYRFEHLIKTTTWEKCLWRHGNVTSTLKPEFRHRHSGTLTQPPDILDFLPTRNTRFHRFICADRYPKMWLCPLSISTMPKQWCDYDITTKFPRFQEMHYWSFLRYRRFETCRNWGSNPSSFPQSTRDVIRSSQCPWRRQIVCIAKNEAVLILDYTEDN